MERGLSEEIAFHLQARAEDLMRRGLSREAATRKARLEFGSVERYRDETRQRLGLTILDDLRGDLRHAWRACAHDKTFTAAAMVSLVLGIGANTTIFTLRNALVLRALPVARPDELVVLVSRNPGAFSNRRFSFDTYEHLRRTDAFRGILASASMPMTVDTDRGEMEPTITGQLVSGNYYELLGVRAVAGRTIAPNDEGAPGSGAVVVLSDGYWQRRYGRNTSVLGSTIRLNSYPLTIVGVSPPGFFGTHVGESADVTVPLSMQSQLMPFRSDSLLSGPGAHQPWLELLARRRSGPASTDVLTLLQPAFQERMEVTRNVAGPKAAMFGHPVLELEPGRTGMSAMRDRFARPLQLLMGSALLVLLIACANVANLLLARGAARRREIAVRNSLGASRWRLVRQLMTESLLLSMASGAIAAALTWGLCERLAGVLAPRSSETLMASIDWTVFAFAFVAALATAPTFGLVPAVRMLRSEAQHDLKAGDRRIVGTAGPFGYSAALVVGQVGLSLVLLVGAGLFVRTLLNLQHVALGFDAEHVLTLKLEPSGSNSKAQQQRRLTHLYDSLTERVQALPGVRSASLSGSTPLSSENLNFLTYVPSASSGSQFVSSAVAGVGAELSVAMTQVFPGYFATLGIPIIAGQDFDPSDNSAQDGVLTTEDTPTKVIVNKVMADRYLSGIGAVGHVFAADPGPMRFQVIGIAADARERDVRKSASPTVYFPYARAKSNRGQMTLVVRTVNDPHAMAPVIRHVVRDSDRSMPLYEIESITSRRLAATAQERLLALMASAFGTLALVVAGIGLYGLMSYTVARKTPEIGIRMALGSTERQVLMTVLGHTAALVGTGIIVGLAMALSATQLVESHLYGLAPTDPSTIFAAILVLGALGMLAGYVPARRAARVNPLMALRQD
jgi:predicted permease